MSVSTQGLEKYQDLAIDMSEHLVTKYPSLHTTIFKLFLAPENIKYILFYIEQSVRVAHRSTNVNMDWDIVFDWIETFISMDDEVLHSSYSNVSDLNLAFRNLMVDPALAADKYVWRWIFELQEKKRNGIDASQLRLYARNPTVIDDRGRPPLKCKENRGVGTMQQRTDFYALTHPFSQARKRQQQALALSNFLPSDDPRVTNMYSFTPVGQRGGEKLRSRGKRRRERWHHRQDGRQVEVGQRTPRYSGVRVPNKHNPKKHYRQQCPEYEQRNLPACWLQSFTPVCFA